MADVTNYPEMTDELLQRYIAQAMQAMAKPPDPNEALRSGLLSAGLGMMAGSRGRNFGEALGQGGLLGLQAYGETKAAQQKDPAKMIALATAMQGMQDRRLNQQSLANFRTATGPQPVPAQYVPQSDVGPGDYAGPVTPPMTPQMVAPATTAPANLTRKVMQDFLLDRSPQVQAMAKNWLEQQDKGARKLKDTKTLVQDGQRVTVNIYDDGSTEVVPFKPDLEKPTLIPMGGKTAAADPFTLEPFKTFVHDPTPGEVMTDARSREQMAQSAQQAAATLAQQQRHFDLNFNAPTIQQTDLGPLLIDKREGVGRPIKDEAGNVIAAPDKPLTEVQSKAVMFGSRMEAASKVIDGLESKAGFKATSPLNQFAGSTGISSPLNYLASKDAQSYKQAQRNWSEAELRYKSGAAVTEAEIVDNMRIYFPQPGDPPELIKQKAEARQQAEMGMRVAMGKRGERQDPQRQEVPGMPSMSAIEAELRRRGIK